MQLVKKILNKFNGLYFSQDYLCLAKEQFEQPLHAYYVKNDRIIADITAKHIFTGYSPLVFTLYSTPADTLELSDSVEIALSDRLIPSNEILQKKDAIARLYLNLIRKQSTGYCDVGFYEGVHGEHHFISHFHQWINGLCNILYNKKPANVFLPGNLFKQVQIAYALPRIISLITVSDGHLFNLFPTDLHGPVDEQYYVSSLRHEGKACRQVESAGRIVISEVHAEMYKTVYSLGKNHMQDLKTRDQFPFDYQTSSLLGLPLPKNTLRYRELELKESFIHGIHKILLYQTVSSNEFSFASIGSSRLPTPDSELPTLGSTLSHIHNVYATFRHNKGLSGNYLMR